MVNSISSLQPKALTFVFCQFILSLRDAASIVSGVGTRSSSSSARRDTDSEIQISEELWPNATTIRQDSTVLMNRKVKSFLNSVSIGAMCGVKSYKCSKFSLSALTQAHNRFATHLLPCQ